MAAKPVTIKAAGFLETFKAWHTDKRVGHALRSWVHLNEVLKDLSLAEVGKALFLEEANKRRENVIKRLKQRYSKLKRDELMRRSL